MRLRKKQRSKAVTSANTKVDVTTRSQVPIREQIDRLGHALARPGGNFDIAPPSNYIFWVGAGFSKTAGIPLADEVVDRLLNKRWRPTVTESAKLRPFCDLALSERTERQGKIRGWATNEQLFGQVSIDDWGEMYGRCLNLLPGEVDRQEFIIECIEEGRGRLNMAHLLLGQLIKNGFINTVLTTNFDDLVLRALQLYFVVPSALDPDSTNTLLTNSRFVQVAYLHGRLASYRQRHTSNEVRNSIPGFENYLAQALQDHGLVVIGYRGGDETPIRLLHKVLLERGTGPGRGLFWVTRGDDASQFPSMVQEILALKDCYWLPGWDADEFMKRLCAWPGIGLGIPNPSEWTKGMEEMLPEEAQKILRMVAPSDIAIEVKKEAGGGAKATEYTSTRSTWFSRAEKLLSAGDSAGAIKVLSKAKPGSEQSIDGLRLWVRAYRIGDRFEEAVTFAKKATELWPEDPESHELLGDTFVWAERSAEAAPAYQLAIAHGKATEQLYVALGAALNVAHRPEESLKPLEAAVEMATSDDYRMSALTWLGISLHDLGKHEEAIEKFSKAEAIGQLDASSYFFWSKALGALGRSPEAQEKEKQYEKLASKRKK